MDPSTSVVMDYLSLRVNPTHRSQFTLQHRKEVKIAKRKNKTIHTQQKGNGTDISI